MLGNRARREAFEREVRIEIEILRKLHGEEALRVALEKAARPTNRTTRRKVLEETVKRLSGVSEPAKPGFFNRLLGSA